MNGEDLLALLGVRQVHEEDLVEASLARQLGRQLSDVVARRHDEDGRLAVLQPGEQPPEDALGEAGVGVAAGVVREALLQLIDHQHARRHLLGHPQRLVEVLLRLADVLVVEPRRLHLEQGQPPLTRHGARDQRLAASLHPEQKNAAARLDPEGLGLRGERLLPLLQPRLEVLEAADLRQVLLRRDVFQHAVLAQHLLLDLDDEVDVPRVQRVVAQDRLRDRALGLERGEAAQAIDEALEVAGSSTLTADMTITRRSWPKAGARSRHLRATAGSAR